MAWLATCRRDASRRSFTAAGAQRATPPTADQVDDFHGTLVADPYRPLEHSDARASRAWIEEQNALTARLSTSSRREQPSAIGETVVDTNFRSRREPNIDVALDADERRFVAILLEIFGRDPNVN